MKPTEYIWKNGQFIRWEDAQVHVMTHALHYGTAVFEGIRAYETAKGPAIFRGPDHFQRLHDSGKFFHMAIGYSVDNLMDITKELIRKNQLTSCYIRPLSYFGYKEMGLYPLNNPVETFIAAWEWGAYLGEEGLKRGIRCKMSSWNRLDSRTMPPMAKSSGNYINSALAKIEAKKCGFDEAILLNTQGKVAEGPGENIFVIRHGVLYTPPCSDGALHGITYQSVIQIAKDLGLQIVQRSLIRDELITADELFFTGTAVEVTPIREIDGYVIGNGTRGPITEQIQSTFFAAIRGQDPRYEGWLSYV